MPKLLWRKAAQAQQALAKAQADFLAELQADRKRFQENKEAAARELKKIKESVEEKL